MKKVLPFTKKQIDKIVKKYPTPIYFYNEQGIERTAHELNKTFEWIKGFKNYFAVKVLPNPYILQVAKKYGMGVDCSSLPELLLAEKAGFKGEEIIFSSNDTPYNEFKKAYDLGAIISLDDISHIPILEKYAGIPSIICFRYNPGNTRRHKGNALIGHPEEAKFGMTKEQLIKGYKTMRDKGVKRFGIHAMIASNELKSKAFIETAEMLFDLVIEISKNLGIKFEFVDLGGGMGIPYKPNEKPVDLEFVSSGIEKIYKKIVKNNLPAVKVFMENGRMITGPHGYLVTRVLHLKDTYKKYVGVDASMANLMRPGMYGAYHHITILGKENKQNTNHYDVVGSLCENNDKFAKNRKLPKVQIGDLLAIHDVGAHAHAMGFNYNGKLRSAELLLKQDRSVKLIRRAETIEDHFATLDFKDLKGVQ